jgi:glycosyltransferase involved in cell wall biosynthesis
VRIGINGLFWHLRWGGIGQMTRELWRAMHTLELPPSAELIMLHPWWQPLADDEYMSIGKHHQAGRPLLKAQRDHLRMLYWEQVSLPQSARQLKLDLLYSPCTIAPVYNPCPVVTTFHDVIPLVLPEYKAETSSRGFQLRWKMAVTAARRARLLLTDSEFSKHDIVRVLGVADEQVVVVYLGVNELYHPTSAEQQAVVRERLGLPASFIFYVGGFEKRKNVSSLLRAYAAALSHLSAQPPLVIVGKPPSAVESARDPALFPDVRGLAAQLGLGEQVLWIGSISDEDKAALFGAATAFVFPSTYEGFGLGPLEAMACGTPTICSNRSSMPEVVGDAAILVDPTNIAELADAIVELFNNPAQQARLREAGPQQAAHFTWEHTARQTLDLLLAASKSPHKERLYCA